MLLQWVETLPNRPFDIWVDDPAFFALTALRVDQCEEFVELVAEFKVVLLANAFLVQIVVLLDEMVSKLIDREQALQACVHVAIERVVV
jgi:hypothetical protein